MPNNIIDRLKTDRVLQGVLAAGAGTGLYGLYRATQKDDVNEDKKERRGRILKTLIGTGLVGAGAAGAITAGSGLLTSNKEEVPKVKPGNGFPGFLLDSALIGGTAGGVGLYRDSKIKKEHLDDLLRTVNKGNDFNIGEQEIREFARRKNITPHVRNFSAKDLINIQRKGNGLYAPFFPKQTEISNRTIRDRTILEKLKAHVSDNRIEGFKDPIRKFRKAGIPFTPDQGKVKGVKGFASSAKGLISRNPRAALLGGGGIGLAALLNL